MRSWNFPFLKRAHLLRQASDRAASLGCSPRSPPVCGLSIADMCSNRRLRRLCSSEPHFVRRMTRSTDSWQFRNVSRAGPLYHSPVFPAWSYSLLLCAMKRSLARYSLPLCESVKSCWMASYRLRCASLLNSVEGAGGLFGSPPCSTSWQRGQSQGVAVLPLGPFAWTAARASRPPCWWRSGRHSTWYMRLQGFPSNVPSQRRFASPSALVQTSHLSS